MAYVDDSLLEDEQDQGGPSLAGSGAPSQKASTSANASGQAAKKTPGNFADLSEYLRVNSPQQFGQRVAGKVGEEINQGTQTLNQAQQDFQSRVDQNTIKDTQGLAQQVGTNPLGVNAQDFAKVRDAEYKGPSNLGETPDLYSRVQSGANKALGSANASQTEGGRFALLDQYFGRPQYTQGQKSLDNLLIQTDQGSKQAFQQMQQNAQALQGSAKNIEPNLTNYASAGRKATEDTRNTTRGALSSAEQAAKSDLSSRVGQANQGIDSGYQSLLNQAKGATDPGLSKEFLQAMGISVPEAGSALGDYMQYAPKDLSKYVVKGAPATAQSVAGSDDVAKFQALNNLAGDDLGFLENYVPGNPLAENRFDDEAFWRDLLEHRANTGGNQYSQPGTIGLPGLPGGART